MDFKIIITTAALFAAIVTLGCAQPLTQTEALRTIQSVQGSK